MISIIIPLYNKEHYILDTINSVFCQTNKDWECVIVDDGSTDRGPELVKNIHDSRIKYLKKKNGGVSSARNFGVSKAMGEWILYLDADDTLKSNCIKDFYIAIDNYPDSDLISANFTISDGQHNQKVGSRCEGYVSNPCSELFFDRLYLRPGAFIIKKDLALEYKYNEVARKCGINVPDYKLLDGKYFASKRFIFCNEVCTRSNRTKSTLW